MDRRTEIRDTFYDIIQNDNVYYNPPEGFRINYPCIIYKLARIDTKFANNLPYKTDRRYTATLIDRNPDSSFVEEILALPHCAFDRSFKTNDLYHWVFDLY